MKFYSEVTEEMYDTIEALQEAEERASVDDEKKQAINEIVALIKQIVEIEKEALKKMREFDEKYGFGTAAKEMLERAGVSQRYEDFGEPFCMKVRIPANTANTANTASDAFVNSLRNFLNK